MRITILFASLLFLATIASPAAAEDDPAQAPRVETDQEAPAFSLTDTDGDLRALNDLRGEKTVLLIFFRGSW